MDVHRELLERYVEPCMKEYGVEDASIGIRYLDICIGGIANHRYENHLRNAIRHIHAMRLRIRIGDDGLPIDFSLKELQNFLRNDSDYALNDIKAAVDTCYSEGYFPDPLECEKKIRRMKVELWKEMDEKDKEISYSRDVFAKTRNAAVGELAVLKFLTRKETKCVKNTIQQQAIAIQQKDDTIKQQAAIIQVKNHTILQQAEANKEKNSTIQQQADTIEQQASTIQQQADTIQQQADNIERIKRLMEERGIKLDDLIMKSL
ncbi:uncharacterized protein LOC134258546 isoform X2 [Saccostrea cucullata]|uniref:uncharacterized protein LOC134258546 isoform X2 n=1 Tax=Saccostrea cuccullata TaxID=36930 RepID=UPI002ED2E461